MQRRAPVANNNIRQSNFQKSAVTNTTANRSKSQAPVSTKKPADLRVGDELVPKGLRVQAIGNIKACQDKCLKHILTNAETLFMSKKIHDRGDWLCSHKEKDQTYDLYQKPGVKNLVTQQRDKIYIFVIDPTITPDFIEKLQRYCGAFYTGMKIEIMFPKSQTFLEDQGVANRENPYSGVIQYNAAQILKKTLPLVPKDAYCMLTVTMQDIYPFDSWNYVFGWANYTSRTGVFSFGRYDPNFEENNGLALSAQDPENELLENACYVMVHEIGHMYGLTHCTFYECIMNGFNSYQEQRRFKRYLCPVCLRKLQSNMQFNVKQRFIDMQKICEEYGFTEMAEYYKQTSKY